jgi:hypothetical protein
MCYASSSSPTVLLTALTPTSWRSRSPPRALSRRVAHECEKLTEASANPESVAAVARLITGISLQLRPVYRPLLSPLPPSPPPPAPTGPTFPPPPPPQCGLGRQPHRLGICLSRGWNTTTRAWRLQAAAAATSRLKWAKGEGVTPATTLKNAGGRKTYKRRRQAQRMRAMRIAKLQRARGARQ